MKAAQSDRNVDRKTTEWRLVLGLIKMSSTQSGPKGPSHESLKSFFFFRKFLLLLYNAVMLFRVQCNLSSFPTGFQMSWKALFSVNLPTSVFYLPSQSTCGSLNHMYFVMVSNWSKPCWVSLDLANPPFFCLCHWFFSFCRNQLQSLEKLESMLATADKARYSNAE